MSHHYRKPPLIEALCEFQFAGDGWDWTIPGLIYPAIEKQFPIRKQANVVEFEMQAQPGEVSQRVRGGVPRVQFVRTDESALVQVGPNLLVVNHLQPYPRWQEFKPLIFDALAVYQQVARPSGFKRIGLRYINRIEIPETGFDFSAYFNLRPPLPEAIPGAFKSLFMRVEVPYAAEGGLLLLTLATAPDARPETTALILDLDFVTLAAQDLSAQTARDWVETAHTQVETAFEACLTDRLRRLFEETER